MNKASLDGIWTHTKSDNNYRVLAISNTNAAEHRKLTDHPVTVFYQDEAGDIWSKPVDKFLKAFTPNVIK